MLAATLGLQPAQSLASAEPEVVISTFDEAQPTWTVAGGSGSVSSSTSPRAEGAGSLRVAYDFRSSNSLSIQPNATPQELPGLPRLLRLDVYGDGSYSTVYAVVRDATGETFRYWMGNTNIVGWHTLSTSLASTATPPAASGNGNADGVLDLPVAVVEIVVYANDKAWQSTVWFDRLTYGFDTGGVGAGPSHFSPASGESTTVSAHFGEAATFTLTATDEAGLRRSWLADGATDWGTSWNGRTADGTLMSGSIRLRLTVTWLGSEHIYGFPYALGLTARPPVGTTASFAGVNTFMTTMDPVLRPAIERLAQRMEMAHVRMARESFDWHRIEPRRGWFEWAKFDQAVEIARAHNVELLGRLQYSAGWASSAAASVQAPDRFYYPPVKVSDFATYARETVHRYKDRIHYWEIWNEPNEANYWRPSPSAAGYTTLLKAAYAAIKAEDPTATVVLGGLSTGPDQSFLDGIWQNGGWNSFDVLAIHAYVIGDPLAPDNILPLWLTLAKQTVDARGVKPIWITEFGWSTYRGSGSSYVGVTEAQQSQYLLNAFRLAVSRGVVGILPYELEDRGADTTAILDNYGAVTTSGREKPSYPMLRCIGMALDDGIAPTCGVERIAGATRFETAAAISAANVSPGAPVAYIATGLNFPDALAGAAIAGARGAPVLLVTRDTVPAATAAELARLHPGKIVVLGGTPVVSDAVLVSLAVYTAGPVERIAGATRFETAAAISAANVSPGAPVAYIATGLNFPDALAGAAIAGARGAPVLLVTRDTVPAATAAELARLHPGKIVVLGGTPVVSDAAAAAAVAAAS